MSTLRSGRGRPPPWREARVAIPPGPVVRSDPHRPFLFQEHPGYLTWIFYFKHVRVHVLGIECRSDMYAYMFQETRYMSDMYAYLLYMYDMSQST